MDTMYHKKSAEAEEAIRAEKAKKEKAASHVADDYNPKLRPRESHPDSISAEKRISRNLNQLNHSLLETPAMEEEEIAIAHEDWGAKVVTKVSAVRVRAPLAMIFTCVLVATVFMYMLSLSIQVDEYSDSIDVMKKEIAELKEESTKLEIQLENKYDLNEVERIATGTYGMVAATALPKKYISISESLEAWKELEQEQEEEPDFWESILSFFGIGGE